MLRLGDGRRLRLSGALLHEQVMGLLALVTLGVSFVPHIFAVAPAEAVAIRSLQWMVVGVFALEYAIRIARAPSRLEALLSPARLFDLAVVLLPFGSIAAASPALHLDLLRAAPALRLLRFARTSTRGRAPGASVDGVAPPPPAERAPLQIRVLRSSRPDEAVPLSWDQFVEMLSDPAEDWFNVSGLHPDDFEKVAEAVGVPPLLLNSKLTEASYPRIELFDRYTSLFVWYPRVKPNSGERVEVERTGTLIIGSAQNLVTLSRAPSDPHTPAIRALPGVEPSAPFLVRTLYALLKHLLRRYEEVVETLERQVHKFEELPIRESTPTFLEETFRMKREVVTVSGNLWRLKDIIRGVAEKRVALHGFEAKHQGMFAILAEEADFVYETVDNVRDALLSLIELHLNVVSFEMNKVMRLLALLTGLALIPTVVGGLLGMNLKEAPWTVTLSQVTWGVVGGMAVLLYVFLAKGWLR